MNVLGHHISRSHWLNSVSLFNQNVNTCFNNYNSLKQLGHQAGVTVVLPYQGIARSHSTCQQTFCSSFFFSHTSFGLYCIDTCTCNPRGWGVGVHIKRTGELAIPLKGHSKLAHMRIRYNFKANLHITETRSILFLTKYDEQKHTQTQVFQ